MFRFHRLILVIAFGMAMGMAPSMTRAGLILTVELDTSPLSGSGFGPFAIAFDLINGDGVASNTSVVVSDFDFGGGGLTGSPDLFGDVSVSSDPLTITLGDSEFFNGFEQGFAPGNLLRFNLTITTSSDEGTPDSFAFFLLGGDGFPLLTDGPADEILFLEMSGGGVSLSQSFATRDSSGNLLLDAPGVAVVPEPGTLTLAFTCAVPLVAIGVHRAWRRRRSHDGFNE